LTDAYRQIGIYAGRICRGRDASYLAPPAQIRT